MLYKTKNHQDGGDFCGVSEYRNIDLTSEAHHRDELCPIPIWWIHASVQSVRSADRPHGVEDMQSTIAAHYSVEQMFCRKNRATVLTMCGWESDDSHHLHFIVSRDNGELLAIVSSKIPFIAMLAL